MSPIRPLNDLRRRPRSRSSERARPARGGEHRVGAGSAPLPDYAAPKARELDTSDRPSVDPVPYWTLTRADFQARRPPAETREHAEKLGRGDLRAGGAGLAELAARGLNARAASLARGFQFETSRPEELAPNAKRYVEGAIRQAMQALVERNAAFDRDTSLGYQPDKQAAWLERVEAELRASQRDARSR